MAAPGLRVGQRRAGQRRLAYLWRMPRRSASSSSGTDLLAADLHAADNQALKPLAERMRPRSLDELVGQRRLLSPGSALRRAIESGRVHLMLHRKRVGEGKEV